jgi:hypothetical protein
MGKMKEKMMRPKQELGRTGIQKAVEIKQTLKREKKVSMIADGIIRAELREKLLGIDQMD